MQQGDIIVVRWNILCRIRDWMTYQKQRAGQKSHLRMFNVHMSAVTCVNAERHKWRSRQMFLNFFWVHAAILLATRHFLNANQVRGGSPKCAACDA